LKVAITFIHGSLGNWSRIPWHPQNTLGTTALADKTEFIRAGRVWHHLCRRTMTKVLQVYLPVWLICVYCLVVYEYECTDI